MLSFSGYVPVKPTATAPVTTADSFEFADSKASDCTANNSEGNLIFTDALKEIQRNHLAATTLEERLALNE